MRGSRSARIDRVAERRRAVALARHFREFEGLSIAQIVDRLGCAPATIKAYFYDPTGEKARERRPDLLGELLIADAEVNRADPDGRL